MKIWRFTFSHDAFYRLPEKKRVFWLQLAQIRNDLRAIDGICIVALNVVRPHNGADEYSEDERRIALHQLIFAVRQLCGTLEEAHKVIHRQWHGTQLSKQMESSLSEEAKNALKAFNKYFNNSANLVTTIRQNFAHHFDSEILKRRLCNCPPDQLREFIAGRISGNTFYKFAEELRYIAIIHAIEGGDMEKAVSRGAITRLYDEPQQKALLPFERFADAVLFKIAEELDLKREDANTREPADPKSLRPFLWFPEPESDFGADMINNVS
jgi:hypothetical protein